MALTAVYSSGIHGHAAWSARPQHAAHNLAGPGAWQVRPILARAAPSVTHASCFGAASVREVQNLRRRSSCSPRAAISDQAQPSKRALIMELDGAVVDLHMDGHRQAFNRSLIWKSRMSACMYAWIYVLSRGCQRLACSPLQSCAVLRYTWHCACRNPSCC
jgi:hypothetical protein